MTKRNYYTIWKIFNRFFIRLDKKPLHWEDRLTLFVGYLVEDGKQSSTVKSYISAIRAVLAENSITLNENHFLLSSLMKACKLVNDQIRAQHPMYFGLFRIGELTSGEHPVKVCDVHLAYNKKTILFILWTSKTHWKNSKPQEIKIRSYQQHERTQKKVKSTGKSNLDHNSLQFPCPYQLLHTYISRRPPYHSNSEAFFVFSNRTPVKPIHVMACLRTMIIQAGFKHLELYTVHGLRSGHACDLLKLGIPIESIKRIGRWRSNAVYRYLR